MAVFLSTLEQMGFLFLIILIGYILHKLKAIPNGTASVLSKLENNVSTRPPRLRWHLSRI